MSRRWPSVFLGLALISGAGCRTPRTSEERAMDDQFNQHWRDGGGFNNPNVERKKQGLPAQNFDGKEPPSFWDGMIRALFFD